jgi:multidrug efflux pump subunit AcrA (membrane-fusion protein)
MTPAEIQLDLYADRPGGFGCGAEKALYGIAISLRADLAEANAKLEIAERRVEELAERGRLLSEMADQSLQQWDTAQEMADKLAYAVAPLEVIGEHSSGNCPWENALELITPVAEVDRLRSENADLEKALGLNEAA